MVVAAPAKAARPKKRAKAPPLSACQPSMKQFLTRPAPPPAASDAKAGAGPLVSVQSEQQHGDGPPATAVASRAPHTIATAASLAAKPAAAALQAKLLPPTQPPPSPPPAPLATALNDEQRHAVEEGDGLVSVEAGPGSGKTRVLVARVLHLLRRRGVPAERILALTFSSKAATEMAQRVRAALAGTGGGSAALPRICTFHSLCAWLLRKHGAANPVPNPVPNPNPNPNANPNPNPSPSPNRNPKQARRWASPPTTRSCRRPNPNPNPHPHHHPNPNPNPNPNPSQGRQLRPENGCVRART